MVQSVILSQEQAKVVFRRYRLSLTIAYLSEFMGDEECELTNGGHSEQSKFLARVGDLCRKKSWNNFKKYTCTI